jgi:hypothetical protein
MIHHLTPYRTTATPVVAVDLNNTLMNQIAGIARASKGRLKVKDFDEWDVDLSAKMGMTKSRYLEWAWSNPYTEMSSPAFTGAARGLASIKRAGWQIWIVTASVLTLGNIEGWLGCNGMAWDRIIKTQDKRGIGNVLIDDSPRTCQQFFDEGLPILRYELPWNSHLTNVLGVGW